MHSYECPLGPLRLKVTAEHNQLLRFCSNGQPVEISQLAPNDLVVFYAGLRSIRNDYRLIYALIGLYVVENIVMAIDVPPSQRGANAHTRKLKIGSPDIVVWGKESISGRLTEFLPIGEWRNRAYRVKPELLKVWGGLKVKDGYIQRSGTPPSFCAPDKFYRWFLDQKPQLIARNN